MSANPEETLAPLYKPAVARDFFKAAGKPEKVAAGKVFFRENEKARSFLFTHEKMYLLLEGEVELSIKGKVIGAVKKGQFFGEMTSITHEPRSATATAKSACRIIALDDNQFHEGLRHQPAFAIMLMSIMIARLRQTIARLASTGAMNEDAALKERAVFDPKRLAELAEGLTNDPPVYFDRNKDIVKEGQAGTRMYAVLEGHVAVSIGGSVVEKLGPGGVFGELSLIEQSPRLASVVAVTDCSLLPINRVAFEMLVKTNTEFAESLLGSLAERLRVLTARLK
jgi:CRP-like cAMP-binding protein